MSESTECHGVRVMELESLSRCHGVGVIELVSLIRCH